jgi:hypothetical protein
MPIDFRAAIKLRAVDAADVVGSAVEYPWDRPSCGSPTRDPTVLFSTPREMDALTERMACLSSSPYVAGDGRCEGDKSPLLGNGTFRTTVDDVTDYKYEFNTS